MTANGIRVFRGPILWVMMDININNLLTGQEMLIGINARFQECSVNDDLSFEKS